MPAATEAARTPAVPPELRLPVTLLSQYLFFLTRRPVSLSNVHYLESRLRGLKSLRPLLESSGVTQLEEIAAQLGALHASALRRRGPGLQLALLPLARAARHLPSDVVVEDGAPQPGWIDALSRVLLVMAPGIGIGDELILAPLPGWLKRVNPGLEVHTLSGYRGVWERVRGVDRSQTYDSQISLLAALRGEAPFDGADLVALCDFEAPELYWGVAAERRIPRYLELSIGSRSAFLLDNTSRWLHRLHHVTPYQDGYYASVHRSARALGLPVGETSRFDGILERRDAPAGEGVEVFVSPFTSKYDPSAAYWSHLLAAVDARREQNRPLRFVLDTGTNASTERFAREVMRSAAARARDGVSFALAPADNGRTVSLPGVLDLLDRAGAVICTDSFCAHAAPLLGCTTLVVARAGVEAWRVPHPRSFYFDGDAPVEQVAAAMADLLDTLAAPREARRLARFSQADVRLARLSGEIEALLDDEPVRDPEALLHAYREFLDALPIVADAMRWRGAHFGAFFEDPFFARAARPPGDRDADAGPRREPLMQHLRDHLERWSNTNLRKFLGTALADGASAARGPERT